MFLTLPAFLIGTVAILVAWTAIFMAKRFRHLSSSFYLKTAEAAMTLILIWGLAVLVNWLHS